MVRHLSNSPQPRQIAPQLTGQWEQYGVGQGDMAELLVAGLSEPWSCDSARAIVAEEVHATACAVSTVRQVAACFYTYAAEDASSRRCKTVTRVHLTGLSSILPCMAVPVAPS